MSQSRVGYLEYCHAHPGVDEIRDKLRRALQFTEEDLECNRSGRLGPSQRHALLNRALIRPAVFVAGAVAFSLALRLIWAGFTEEKSVATFAGRLLVDLFTLNFSALYRDYGSSGGDDLPQIIRAFLILPVGFALLRVWKPSAGALADLFSAVANVQGNAAVESEERAGGRFQNPTDPVTRYFFAVDSKRFPAPALAHDALLHGVRYCIYYSASSRTVLSAEPILEAAVAQDTSPKH